jgi:hypothetical protein
LAWNQDNLSEWNDMPSHELLIQRTLEKTEGEIKNEQSRETDKIWIEKTRDDDKQNKEHNTEI